MPVLSVVLDDPTHAENLEQHVGPLERVAGVERVLETPGGELLEGVQDVGGDPYLFPGVAVVSFGGQPAFFCGLGV